ncbi:MAG: hypothetical protein LKJ13_01675 [Clostridia bacterium]|jgi:multidrug efflux pump subunit AcrA (membrane-fusion protein)|nr:hypothetical protein [Clostridia bacterium]
MTQQRKSKVSLRKVVLGEITGDKIQILSGISTGDKLVTSGQYQLKDGESVSLKEAEKE